MNYTTPLSAERAGCIRETEDTPAASAAMAPGPTARAGRHVWRAEDGTGTREGGNRE